MTTAELDSHKMILVREIINHFNTEESLQKLAEACSIIRKEEESEAYHAIPEPLFQQLMDIAEEQIKTGQYLTDEELLEDMKYIGCNRQETACGNLQINPEVLQQLLNNNPNK